MSTNKLYNLIKTILVPKNDGLNFSEKTHNLGTNYFLFELPEKTISIEPYTLTSHHLSVYDKPLSVLDSKSQYHYTAFFDDNKGQKYRLHIYYNDQDNSVSNPLLSEVISENNFVPVNCLEHEEAFKVLGQFSINSLVNYLRNEQKNTVKMLQLQCDELEKSAEFLSINLLKNKDEYLLVIAQLVKKMDELLEYTLATRSILAKKSFLVSLANAIETSSEPETIISKPKKTQNNKANSKVKINEPKPSPKKDSKPAQKPLITDKLVSLKFNFDHMNKLALDNQLKSIESLYGELKELELGLTFGSFSASVQDLQELKKLKDQMEDKGRILLQNLLHTSQFEEAEKLKIFYPFLSPENMMYIAFHLNNFKTFELLLKNKVLDIHTKNLTILKANYTSMIDYCFKETKSNHPKLECLNVLLQQGASLLEIDSETGLPFAAILLLEPNHPLGPVLQQNLATTLDNPMFYKQLNKLLALLQVQGEFKIYSQDEISKLIEANQCKLSTLKMNYAFGGESYKRSADELIQQMKVSYGEEIVTQLFADPDFMALTTRLNDRTTQYLAKLPFKERVSVASYSKIIMNDFAKSIAAKDMTGGASFDVSKQQCLKVLFTRITIIDLNEQILSLNQIIQSNPGRPKLVKQALVKGENLRKEITRLDKEINESCKPSKPPARTHSNNEFHPLNNLINTLEGLLDNNQPTDNKSSQPYSENPTVKTFFSESDKSNLELKEEPSEHQTYQS